MNMKKRLMVLVLGLTVLALPCLAQSSNDRAFLNSVARKTMYAIISIPGAADTPIELGEFNADGKIFSMEGEKSTFTSTDSKTSATYTSGDGTLYFRINGNKIVAFTATELSGKKTDVYNDTIAAVKASNSSATVVFVLQ